MTAQDMTEHVHVLESGIRMQRPGLVFDKQQHQPYRHDVLSSLNRPSVVSNITPFCHPTPLPCLPTYLGT
ncbi:hypothetical protein VTJ04DRAFT_6210 [Mycothermus thermophilus]|uniref:uncharacterized protein n=1 Tax=Humicola insolens TaxID=85995 RepID=UPI003742220B